MRSLDLQLTEPQQEFLSLDNKYRAFVGGFGCGKTRTLCTVAVLDALISPHAIVYCYEPTYKLVRDVLAPTMQAVLDDFGIYYTYNKMDKQIITNDPQCGNFTFDTMDDPDKIVGYECYTCHIDEIDTLPTEKARRAWLQIIARARQRIPGGVNRVNTYTTPEGFKFVYDRWVKNTTSKYGLVQASTYSNPWRAEDYIESLEDSYPAELIEAYINGKFVNLTAGTVYRSYNRARHGSSEVVRLKVEHVPYVGEVQPDILYIGMDFNIDHMAAVVFVKRKDAFHVVDEVIDGYKTQSVIDTLKERYPNNRLIVYPDSSGKNRHTGGTGKVSESDIATLQQNKIECRYKSTNPRIKDRVMAVNKSFENGKLSINANKCPSTAQALEQQAYNKNNEPDKSSGVDHVLDALGYMIAYELPIHRPAVNYNVEFIG